jgi:hypothetical protein
VKRLVLALCSLGAVLLLGAGCDDLGFFGERPDVSEEFRSLGVVTFHSASTIDPQGAAAGSSGRFNVEARFVRFDPPFESEVREVLGLADLDALPPTDACSAALRVPAAAPPLDPATATAGVELLDVGRILVRGGGAEENLSVRTFPDLLDVMSGVTYGGTSALPFAPGRRYDVRG